MANRGYREDPFSKLYLGWMSFWTVHKFVVLSLAAGLVGAGILVLTVVIFSPLLFGHAPDQEETKVEVPPYDYQPFASWPVQFSGRVMPFRTATEEIVRNVTGRAKFQGKDPTAIVLQWMLLKGTSDGTNYANWEKYPFILCDNHDLRSIIYREQLEDSKETKDPKELAARQEMLHGKYVSPEDLRKSEGFKQLVDQAEEIREDDPDKAQQLMSPEQRKAEEVAGRLVQFDSVSQNNPPTWGTRARQQHHDSPIQVVALDRVSGGGWFSISQLYDSKQDEDHHNQLAANDPEREKLTKWQQIMKDRLADSPQLYLKPELRQALEAFQQEVKAGRGEKAVDDLAEPMKQQRQQKVAEFEQAVNIGDTTQVMAILGEVARKPDDLKRFNTEDLKQLIGQAGDTKETQDKARTAVAHELAAILAERDDEVIDQMKKRLPKTGSKYHPDDKRFRMLHLNYLESRFPRLYPESAAWQEFPRDKAERVLASYVKLRDGYKSGDSPAFQDASQDFFGTLGVVSEDVGPYPGDDTIGTRIQSIAGGDAPGAPGTGLLNLEMTYDSLQPYRWGWVLMLCGLLLFSLSLAMESKVLYYGAFAAYFASLGFQVFGFFTRIIIAARPPVSNMYETVIWVSFMSAIFGLILELIYRRKVIGLAAAMVSTLGLVLADQLPLVLDPKISPLVPVLRSNYWLTIHVLTIVSSYAGGTLAWGLGNVSLALLAFSSHRRDLLKTLATFTYRAIQIAVLLLAAGTFLGGWWAAESWGRFWGWDPKEVWALIALVCYVIPLHARFIGWVKDFGLAVSAVVCYAAIVMSWYGVNFVLGAGLHSYGFGGGGPWWVFWAGLINIEWVLIASMIYLAKTSRSVPTPQPQEEYASA